MYIASQPLHYTSAFVVKTQRSMRRIQIEIFLVASALAMRHGSSSKKHLTHKISLLVGLQIELAFLCNLSYIQKYLKPLYDLRQLSLTQQTIILLLWITPQPSGEYEARVGFVWYKPPFFSYVDFAWKIVVSIRTR